MIKKGFVVEGQEKEKVKALKKMRAMGLITIETQGFAQCPKMHAFVKMTGGFEEECPVCMQNFVPKKVKQCFVVGKVCDNKIIDYLQGLLSDFFPEQGIDDEFGVINVKLGDSQGKVVWLGANTNDVYLTPTADDFVIRIMPSLIGITRGTEDKKFIELEEIVNNPDNLKQLTQILL
ncbi:MAG: hypothetical protein NTY48_04565, partial [Candidatus Diapherotrites archaeon]|nr:hypothetical protein [Candidatus Diapherotrites archaeon]